MGFLQRVRGRDSLTVDCVQNTGRWRGGEVARRRGGKEAKRLPAPEECSRTIILLISCNSGSLGNITSLQVKVLKSEVSKSKVHVDARQRKTEFRAEEL